MHGITAQTSFAAADTSTLAGPSTCTGMDCVMSRRHDTPTIMRSNHAFTAWVSGLAREHARALAGAARREGLSADDALDAVQEAFHTLLSLPQGRPLAENLEDARGFLVVLVRNAARNMRRRHFRARPHEDADNLALASELPTTDEVIARAEDHLTLLGCVSRLAEAQRHVVTLRMLEELSGEDTARELGLTPGHVAVLLHRAKKVLLACIDPGREPSSDISRW